MRARVAHLTILVPLHAWARVAHPRRSFYTGWYEVIGTRSSYIMMSCDIHHLVMVICYQLIMVMGCDIRGRTTRVCELPMDGLTHHSFASLFVFLGYFPCFL